MNEDFGATKFMEIIPVTSNAVHHSENPDFNKLVRIKTEPEDISDQHHNVDAANELESRQEVSENLEVVGVQNADFASVRNRFPADRLTSVSDEFSRPQNDGMRCSSTELHSSEMDSDEVNMKTEIGETRSLYDGGHESDSHDGGEISGLQVTDLSDCSYESSAHDPMSICLKADTGRKLNDSGACRQLLHGHTVVARCRQTRSNRDSCVTFELVDQRKRKVSAAKKLFECDECHKVYNFPSLLERHMLTHSSHKPYVCETCNKAFGRPFALQKHQQAHAARPAYECDVCHLTFSYAGRLSIHKRIHRDVKPQICDVCNEVFIGAENLTAHKRTHNGEPPRLYACEICNRSFSRLSNLATHKRFHTDDKPYVCSVCNIAFGQLHNLEAHKRIHSTEKGHKCYMCDTVFNDVGDLIAHRLVHSDDTQLVCDTCNMSFNSARKLSRHKPCHTRVNRFTCPICKMAFRHQNSLFKHVDTHAVVVNSTGEACATRPLSTAVPWQDTGE